MADSRMIEELNQEVIKLRRFLTSPDWQVWSNFLRKERRAFLQNRVNAAVRDGKLEEARIAVALLDDCLKQIELFGKHVSDAESRLKGAEKNGNKA